MNKTIIESKLYSDCLTELGDTKKLDDALSSLIWALSNHPERYPIVPRTIKLRIAKTQRAKWDGLIIPALRVWFIIKDNNEVELMFLEIIANE